MSSPLPPDPYLALGVPKDANQAAVKTAHRKLVLKCHPDKVTDPTAKQAASDLFHKIQTAYEILVDADRRARYDAQVRLADLKKEAMERHGGKSSRAAEYSASSPYKSSQESAAPRGSYNVRAGDRPAPQYEERRPAYAADYFDPPPRSSVRKEREQERAFRRPASDSKDKARTSTRETKEKEVEKERRRERTRRADQDTRRDRDRKTSTAYVEDESESDSDDYARRSRQMRDEDEMEKLRKARDAYNEQVEKQKREASNGYFDDRTRKMFAATSDAWDHIRSSRRKPEPEPRPSAARQGSSKDKFDYIKGKDGRPPVVVRRGSERPTTSGRDFEQPRRTSPRSTERRSSAEDVGEIRPTPTLNTSRSSPADIRNMSSEKPRAQSVQVEKDLGPEIPSVRRAETMPYNTGASRRSAENTVPVRNRPTEFSEGLPTPATTPATPEWTGPFAPTPTNKANYPRAYADDAEYATPDGYRVEMRHPQETVRPKFTRKVTRSPSPARDIREARDPRDSREMPREMPRDSQRERPERSRTTSSRYPEPARPSLSNNTRTTSYVYAPGAAGVEQLDRSRPGTARGADPRDARPLYGEMGRPPSGSPRQKYSAFEPPEESSYRRRPEDLRPQAGSYGNYRKPMSRNGSGNPIYTSARA